MKIKLDNEIKNLISSNQEKINKKVTGTVEIKENTDPSVYFEIHEDDSLLTDIVKESINERKINIKNLEFKDQRELNNYKRSLDIHRTMSINKFERWMDLMDIPWKLIYGDEVAEYEAWKRQQRKKGGAQYE